MVTLMTMLSNRVGSDSMHQVESLVEAADAAPSGVTDAVEDEW